MSQPAALMVNEPAPIDLDRVLSRDWLGRALGGDRPIDIASVRVIDQFGPSATKVRIKLELGPSAPAGFHADYCIKGFFGDTALKYLASGVQRTEALFYTDCVPNMPGLRTADCVYAGIDEETLAGVMVMKDITSAGGRFLTALEPYTMEQARGSLEQLAVLHAGGWGDAALARHPWLVARIEQLVQYDLVPAARLTELMRQERGATLPDDVRDGHRIYAALAKLGALQAPLPACFIHGDIHAGNVFLLPEGPGFVDWQLFQRGHWSLDVAYHIAAVLDLDSRRANEADLVRHYLASLKALGVDAPGFEDAWDWYRRSVAYGLFLWGITIRVDPPIIAEFVHRLGTAVADHDSFGRLGV